jgi:hypothetical protein
VQKQRSQYLKIENDGTMWLESSIDDWNVKYRLNVQRGRIVVSELHVKPRPWRPSLVGLGYKSGPGVRTIPIGEIDRRANEEARQGLHIPVGGLSTRILRRVPLGHDVHSVAQILEEAQRTHPELLRPDGVLGRQGVTAKIAIGPERVSVSRRGRPRLPLSEYAILAEAYAKAVAAGSRKPVEELAIRVKQPISRIRSRIREARRLGLLDLGKQGNAGGSLTPAARKLLKSIKRGRHGKASRKK